MMPRHLVPRALATAAVALAAGVVAYDVIGPDALGRMWAALTSWSAPSAAAASFDTEQELNFFVYAPIVGSELKVTTGVAYATMADLNAGKPQRSWCYISVGHSLSRTELFLSLGSQDGSDAPVYADESDFSAGAVAPFGLSARQAAQLARSHCRFGKVDPLARQPQTDDPPTVPGQDV